MWKTDIHKIIISPFEPYVMFTNNAIWVACAKFIDEYATKELKLQDIDENQEITIENLDIWIKKTPICDASNQELIGFIDTFNTFADAIANDPTPPPIQASVKAYLEKKKFESEYKLGPNTLKPVKHVIVHLPVLRWEK